MAPTHPPPAEVVVREISSLEEWDERVMQCQTPVAVVKFYQDGCRSCRALKPKYDAIAQEQLCGATFFEVNLKRGRPIFDAEQIRVAPSIHIFCRGIGRVSGSGFSGAKVITTMRAALLTVLEPERLAALEAIPSRTLRPPMRYAALVELLRTLKQAPRLLDQGAKEAAPTVSELRRSEASELMGWLDGAGSGVLSIDDLAAATCALGAAGGTAGGTAGGSGEELKPGCFAPLSLVAAGLDVESASLERAVEAVHGLRAQQQAPPVADGGSVDDGVVQRALALATGQPACRREVDLHGLRALLAAQDAELLRRTKSRGDHVSAAAAALGVRQSQSLSEVPLSLPDAAERLARFDATFRLPPGEAPVDAAEIESMLSALDLSGRAEVDATLFARAVVRAWR